MSLAHELMSSAHAHERMLMGWAHEHMAASILCLSIHFVHSRSPRNTRISSIRISEYPDIQVSGYPYSRISGYPDIRNASTFERMIRSSGNAVTAFRVLCRLRLVRDCSLNVSINRTIRVVATLGPVDGQNE